MAGRIQEVRVTVKRHTFLIKAHHTNDSTYYIQIAFVIVGSYAHEAEPLTSLLEPLYPLRLAR